ncbi:hypothetical protein BBO99_00003741 [Phytophthora kernoviae]|uniref:Uncharacterized protein n=2 Tax=Phytophthora kernoviae TaxID=325452 RepID=A0A3R7J422_9STRA|nr:hypothetical protein G195_008788 [Phytophthora kernoviae 00238/432]KAG2517343.1 hypothetical protein JM16_007453 [Phytophthora kernoviae]KAG2519945.1 hypothetical protein JM18_007342 [Phytophthora kernoviae]RLM96195.1 hypothetical protein BBI17_003774 [Phytophthora kernoviae]RLN81392.1 hypothetical protein BBO99_00003741 [Phytophthora kernoviae]
MVTPAWREGQTLSAHVKPISSLSFSPTEQLLASSSADSSVKIWRLSSSNDELEKPPVAALFGHTAGVSAACWSPDSRYVASASDDRTARLWDVEKTKTLMTLGVTYRSLDAAMNTPLTLLEGSAAVLGITEGVENGSVPASDPSQETHKGFVSCVAFNPQGSLVATGSHDENVRLWDVRSGRSVVTIGAHQEPVVSVGFHPTNGSLLVTAGYDGLVRVWDVASRQCLRSIISEPAAPVGSARFTPNGRYVVSATLDNTVRLWDHMRDICVRSFTGHVNRKFGLQCAFLEQRWNKQAVMACGSEDSRIFMWDVGTQETSTILTGHEHPVLALAGHSTRALLASGSNRDIKMWTPSVEGDNNGKAREQSNGVAQEEK